MFQILGRRADSLRIGHYTNFLDTTASTTVRYDDTATRLDEFLGWLLSKDSQAAMPGGGRSFRRWTAEFW